VVTVPTGVTQTFRLQGSETLGTAASTTVWGTLTAEYFPFVGSGSNALPPVMVDALKDPVAHPAK
jgi:hypothetical protein